MRPRQTQSKKQEEQKGRADRAVAATTEKPCAWITKRSGMFVILDRNQKGRINANNTWQPNRSVGWLGTAGRPPGRPEVSANAVDRQSVVGVEFHRFVQAGARADAQSANGGAEEHGVHLRDDQCG